jgi:predicted nucleic acid-binding protein
MNAVDTNVLIYAHDPRDGRKQAIAQSLVGSLSDAVLPWQVACEFLAASRKLQSQGFSFEDALAEVRALRQVWSTILPDWSAIDKADELMIRFSLSWWDSLLIASCVLAGVRTLYSEDYDSYSEIDGVELQNPFRKGP